MGNMDSKRLNTRMIPSKIGKDTRKDGIRQENGQKKEEFYLSFLQKKESEPLDEKISGLLLEPQKV